MSKMRSVVVGAVLLIGSTAGAAAADMWVPAGSMKDGGVPVDPSVAIYEGATWYLRGDIGYVWNEDPDVYARDQYLPGIRHTFDGSTMEDTWSIGAGIGYYFSRHLRGDLTIDYRSESGVKGRVADNHAYFDSVADDDFANQGLNDLVYDDDADGDGITNMLRVPGIYYEDPTTGAEKTHIAGNYAFDIQSTVFLANLYYDFGARGHGGMKDAHHGWDYGLRPYIGVGLGFARHEISTSEIETLQQANCGCPGTIASSDDTTFAYALMAGVSKSWRQGVNLDFGYRFTHLGEVATGVALHTDRSLVGDGWTGDIETVQDVEKLYSHEVRLGVRYDIW